MQVKDRALAAPANAPDPAVLAEDAEIERFQAAAEITLGNIEHKYYQLLKALRPREPELAGTTQGTGAGREKQTGDMRLRVDKAAEEMKLALNNAIREFCEINDPHERLANPPSTTVGIC